MKKIIIILISGLFLIFAYLIYFWNYSEETIRGKKNLENYSKIKMGMDTNAVLKIMGPPYLKDTDNGEAYYNYEAPSGSSIHMQITFDKKGKVVSFDNIK